MDYRPLDLLDGEGLAQSMEGIDGVIHCAGLAHVFHKGTRSEDFQAINELGTARVMQAAVTAGVRHLVLVSSVSVYGRHGGASDEKTHCKPDSAYARSKYQAELRAVEIAEAAGLNLTILRPATLYGEGDPGNVARLMRAIDRGRFFWVGKGNNCKSLVHRDDAARACLAALQHPLPGIGIYNVSGAPRTMREIVEGLAAALGRRPPRWSIPAGLVLAVARGAALLVGGRGRLGSLPSTMQKWLADDVYDGSKFQRTFNFTMDVDLAEGLRREVAWHRSSGK
jgi:UDP-glucose 4-epimerase